MSIAARNIVRLLGASAAIVVAAAMLTFTIDPLQLFRPARFLRRCIRRTAACKPPA
jgi:hypothetical protein